MVVGVLGVVVLAAVAFVAWALWWPLPAGTPRLSPEMEALRPWAIGIGEARPLHRDDWTLILTSTRTEHVYVDFENSRGTQNAIRIPVGSSTEVLGCTISVLETHPGRSGREPGSQTSRALIAVQCPPSLTPTPDSGTTDGPAPSSTP